MKGKSTTTHIKVPPQNIDGEKALLGSIMLRPEVMYDVADLASASSFYSDKHRIIFQAMLEIHNRHEPIDLLSVSSRLAEKKQLEQIGGRTYLSELVSLVPSAINARNYASIIQKKHILRSLIEASEFIGNLGFNEEDEVEEVLDKAEKKIFSITNLTSDQKFLILRDGLEEAWERLDKLHKEKDKIRGVTTGFAELDNLLAGFQKSDLIILAARPSMGKTTLALDIARRAAGEHGIPVGIFSLEMSSQQLVDRMIAAESLVDAWKLRTGKLKTDEDFTKIRDSLDRLSQAPIYIDDNASNTIIHMRSVARRLKREHDLQLLVIDYMQLVQTSRTYDSMVQQVTEISRSMKSLARELDIPVLALSQLSRAVEQRRDRPRLSDLRDSGSIEQDADVVMFIHRSDKYKDDEEKTNVTEIDIAKHRNGPLGKVKLYFDEQRGTFLSLEKSNVAGAGVTAEELEF
ncbi:replicative DNA helicase [bacterium]|nr:replicative DNA helicase [bacterium]|tara:strand:+ start:4278 stop:5660 length:1383 start_codon:yes stop_codon:yes gene_type:complete